MYQLPEFERDFIYTDINAGLDYERAVARLNERVGRAFSRYLSAKQRLETDAHELARLNDAYLDALAEKQKLSPHDAVRIREILT